VSIEDLELLDVEIVSAVKISRHGSMDVEEWRKLLFGSDGYVLMVLRLVLTWWQLVCAVFVERLTLVLKMTLA
jgi:hypothetical protein